MLSGAATIAVAPRVPWPLLAALAAAALLLCGYALYRRAGGAWLRLGALAAGLLALANPSLVEEQRDLVRQARRCRQLIAEGVIDAGMVPKVDAALRVLAWRPRGVCMIELSSRSVLSAGRSSPS